MRPLLLVILDGWGYSSQRLGNAIADAKTPTMDFFRANYPMVLLQASGNAVGLGWGEPGNSEVGHLTIGAGRTIYQYSPRINRAIENGTFFQNPALVNAMAHAADNKSSLHIIGLLGSGTVHSSLSHLIALLEMAKRRNLSRVYVHIFTDGKDSGLKEAPILIKKLQAELARIGIGKIASIIGRNYAMNRDHNWDRTKTAYDLWTAGIGLKADDPISAIQDQYQNGSDDTYMKPIILDHNASINDRDSVIFFNFREDSMNQIVRPFVDRSFSSFSVQPIENSFVTLMTQYVEIPGVQLNIAFPPPEINNCLAQIISEHGWRQLHIAETEKYAHTTYFFNGLRQEPFEGEQDILVESYKSHLQHPEMKALEIADRFLQESDKNIYEFSVINFANADILSHAGDLTMTTRGIEFIDSALAKIYQPFLEKNGILVITADHGNAESLVYAGSGDAETKHNLNPVPFYLIAPEYQKEKTEAEIAAMNDRARGLISDVAPTILELLGVQKPVEMTGESLLNLLF